MNTLVVPPSANWYESNILVCAPDNTLVYGARNDIVILENSDPILAANVRIISRAHSQKVICININKTWGQPQKLAVSLSDDKYVKIWDVECGKKLYSHNKHVTHNKVIGATFAGDERVISVSEDGSIIVWNLGLNETNIIKDLLGLKVSVTCLSTCPHAPWLTAFGLKNGLVVVADLRKKGKLLYKMRGHDKSVISLSWCPVPINIFPKNPHNFVNQKKIDNKDKEIVEFNRAETQNTLDSQEVSYVLLKAYGYDLDDTKYLQKYYLNQYEGTSSEYFRLIKTSNETYKTEIIDNEIESKHQLHEELNKEITSINDEDSQIKLDESADLKSEDNSPEKLLKHKNESISIIDISGISMIDTSGISVIDTSASSNIDIEINTQDKDLNTCSTVGRDIVTKPIAEEEEDPRKEFLLASSSKEGNIYIWRAGTDGRMQTFLTVPNKTGGRKYKTPVDKIWITLCWVSPSILLSSSRSSELLAWTLPKPQDGTKLYTVIHKDHSSLLFSISAPLQLKNECNWKEVSEINAWTMSQDRLLLNTSISSERTNLASYPTFGGSIQSLQLSPLDPNRLAIGTADGFIKFWDLSRPHKQNIIMTSFYQKIQSKVSAIAWHPTNELLFSFGTMEGRVGYMDPNNKSKTPVLLPQYFKSQVFKLEWAPINGHKEHLGLYAVGEGHLLLFDINKSSKGPIEIDKPDNTFIYSMSWKPDYSILLLTTKTGHLIVYSPDMKIICKHYFQYRINNIVWHPNAVISGTNESNWFAAISNNKTVLVYNFDVESGNNDENIINMYQGNGDMINGIAWSPYEPSLLVMACEIGVAQIWDVVKNEIISTYINPNFESVLCVIWSPVDPGFIISGGKDNAIRIWKISEQEQITGNEILNRKKKMLKENVPEMSDILLKAEQPVEEAVKVKKPVKNGLLPSYYAPKTSSQIVSDLKKLLLWKENPSIVETEIGDNNEIDILNIFGSYEAMMSLVNLNELDHRQKGKYSLNTKLSLFRGDISTSIKEAIDQKRVTLEIISLAPMVSPKLWQTACETYALQLSEESNSDPLEIATYYLACHKVQKAVDCLCDAFLFREALALAKCRMLEEAINDIIEKWSAYAVQTGNFEVAAQCNIFLGKYEEAASVLFRRSDAEILQFAVQLAEKAGNAELKKAVIFRYNAFNDDVDKHIDIDLPSKQDLFLEQKGIKNGFDDDRDINEDVTIGVKNNLNGPESNQNLDIFKQNEGKDLQNVA